MSSGNVGAEPNTAGAAPAPIPGRYKAFVKYCRRGSTVLVNVALLYGFKNGAAGLLALWGTTSDALPRLSGLPPNRMVTLALIVWFAFLSQLRLRWVLWLPVYLVAFPGYWLLGKLLKLVGRPVLTRVQAFASAGASAVPAGSSPKKRSFPTKRVWLLFFFTWFIALRSLNAGWATWIPPFLAIPVWLWCLRTSYRTATSPTTLAEGLLAANLTALENVIRSLNEAKEGKPKGAASDSRFAHGFARFLLSRYKPETILPVIQREAILVFSMALLATFTASAVMWGLVGRALLHTEPAALQAYSFFSSRSLLECVLWSVGCMTTSISFPGSAAPVWLKALHGSILATGVFQLTYLLACFSIMANAEGQRTVGRATELVQRTFARFEESQTLEAAVRHQLGGPGPPKEV